MLGSTSFPGQHVNSIGKLASVNGYSWEYEHLYHAFPALVHSRGIGHDVTIKGTELSLHHPHDPIWFEMIAYFMLGWQLMFVMTAAKWIAPEMIGQLQQLPLRHRTAIESLRPNELPKLLA